jgi:hypothetical protein
MHEVLRPSPFSPCYRVRTCEGRGAIRNYAGNNAIGRREMVAATVHKYRNLQMQRCRQSGVFVLVKRWTMCTIGFEYPAQQHRSKRPLGTRDVSS